jgi:hypothetical protein
VPFISTKKAASCFASTGTAQLNKLKQEKPETQENNAELVTNRYLVIGYHSGHKRREEIHRDETKGAFDHLLQVPALLVALPTAANSN